MQLLFDKSEEFGEHPGLGLIPGRIVSMREAFDQADIDLKVPQIGWNKLDIRNTECPLVKSLGPVILSIMFIATLQRIVKSIWSPTANTDSLSQGSYKIKMSSVPNSTQKKVEKSA